MARPDRRQPARRPAREPVPARVPPVVPFALGLAGIGLILAAVKNTSPVQQLRAVLSGSGSKPAPIDNGAGIADTGVTFAGSQPIVSVATGNEPPGLVSIGQGNHRLRADAAAAFALWQTQYGATITVTDSYRSYATQAAGYAKDPKRFAPPDKSEHVKGTAVDVNLSAIGATPPTNGKPGSAQWQKLYATAAATGWHNPRGPYAGDHAEPWHFSRNGG